MIFSQNYGIALEADQLIIIGVWLVALCNNDYLAIFLMGDAKHHYF